MNYTEVMAITDLKEFTANSHIRTRLYYEMLDAHKLAIKYNGKAFRRLLDLECYAMSLEIRISKNWNIYTIEDSINILNIFYKEKSKIFSEVEKICKDDGIIFLPLSSSPPPPPSSSLISKYFFILLIVFLGYFFFNWLVALILLSLLLVMMMMSYNHSENER